MVQVAIASLPHIQAGLNYLVATNEKPVTYAYQPPSGVPWSTAEIEEHATVIHDLRPAASKFLLDDVGFQLLTHRSAVKNFWDEEDVKRVYYPESVDFLKRVTGASEVRVFDHTLRRRMPGRTTALRSPESLASPPIAFMSIRRPRPGRRASGSPIPTKPTNCFAAASPSSICGGRSNRGRSMRRLPCATRAASRREISSPPILSFATGAARLTISSIIRANAGSMRRQCARTKCCSSNVSIRAMTAPWRASLRIRRLSIRPRPRTRRPARASNCAPSLFSERTRPGIDAGRTPGLLSA
jgi:hypothetical protein